MKRLNYIDLGVHKGQEMDLVLEQYEKYEDKFDLIIYGVEAYKAHFEGLKNKYKNNNRVKLFNNAITHKTGFTNLYLSIGGSQLGNSLYSSKKTINSKNLDFKTLNNLDFREANPKKFPLIKVLKMLTNNTSLFETILVSINDKFVELFLKNKIKFTDISKKMNKMLNLYSLQKYKKIKPKNIEEIVEMNTKIKNDIEHLINN